jgi:hypothetical protein
MDTISGKSQTGTTRQLSPEYVGRLMKGLVVLARWPGMDDVYGPLMSNFICDIQRALQAGWPSVRVIDAILTAFSDNPDARSHLRAAIDAAVDFKLMSIAGCYNLCLLRAYFDVMADDEPRNVIYSGRSVPCLLSDYPVAWQTAHDYCPSLILRLGQAEQVIRANPCRHTLDSQLLDEALFYDDLEPESETDDESPEILHDMKREYDPAVVQATLKSGLAKNIYQAVAHAQLTREYLVVTLARKATEWRVKDGKVGLGGIVVFPPVNPARPAGIDRIEVSGWSNELRSPEHWVPGCIAVNKDGKCWEAKGGDEQHGADAWVPMWTPR